MKIIVPTVVLSVFLAGSAYAGEPASVPAAATGRAVITPYGDFCPQCSIYGIGQHPVRTHKAVAAAQAYFAKKGLTIKKIRGRRRFILMDVYREDKLVDRVILDRRTGRLRSIY